MDSGYRKLGRRMKSIIVHDLIRLGNPSMFINVNAISAVKREFSTRAYTAIYVGNFVFSVVEDFDTIMQKIKEAESEE